MKNNFLLTDNTFDLPMMTTMYRMDCISPQNQEAILNYYESLMVANKMRNLPEDIVINKENQGCWHIQISKPSYGFIFQRDYNDFILSYIQNVNVNALELIRNSKGGYRADFKHLKKDFSNFDFTEHVDMGDLVVNKKHTIFDSWHNDFECKTQLYFQIAFNYQYDSLVGVSQDVLNEFQEKAPKGLYRNVNKIVQYFVTGKI